MVVKNRSIKTISSDSESETAKKPLQFIVDESFHREFKAYAARKGVKMSDLFREMYELYRDAKG